MFGDEASFWLDGTLHRTWARVGEQPRVPTFGMRKTAHVFGAVTLEEKPKFVHQFAPRFCGATFLDFLKLLVRRLRRKIFLILDNGPCHNLEEEGVEQVEDPSASSIAGTTADDGGTRLPPR